jgi:hypothetical protein
VGEAVDQMRFQQDEDNKKRAGPKPRPERNRAGLKACSNKPFYQFTRTPMRATRGARIAWIWFAFAAF